MHILFSSSFNISVDNRLRFGKEVTKSSNERIVYAQKTFGEIGRKFSNASRLQIIFASHDEQ